MKTEAEKWLTKYDRLMQELNTSTQGVPFKTYKNKECYITRTLFDGSELVYYRNTYYLNKG